MRTRKDIPTQKEKTPRRPIRTGALVGKIIVGIVLAALLALGTWQFLELQRLRAGDQTAEQARADAAKLKDKVGKIIQLPDEDATVATVQDVSKLSEQEFFKDAKDGDKVLIFTAAKRAVIYRESDNKVINSGPIVINSTTS
jgi:hypothetical protein